MKNKLNVMILLSVLSIFFGYLACKQNENVSGSAGAVVELAPQNSKKCDDILIDYIKRLDQLRSGNTKPLSEFPIDTDPAIRNCINNNPDFRSKLDSLQDIGKKLVEELLKQYN